LIQTFVFPDIAAPSWLEVDHYGLGKLGTGTGLVFGLAAELLAMVREREAIGTAIGQHLSAGRVLANDRLEFRVGLDGYTPKIATALKF
jgi:hypothetical protein